MTLPSFAGVDVVLFPGPLLSFTFAWAGGLGTEHEEAGHVVAEDCDFMQGFIAAPACVVEFCDGAPDLAIRCEELTGGDCPESQCAVWLAKGEI